MLYAWQDTTLTPTLTASSGWTKIGQSDIRPAIGIWYSTTATGTATINGAAYQGSGTSEDWNAVRLSFTPNQVINTVTVSVFDFEGSTSSYSHQITPPSDGANYTYIHAWGVSGRPRNNTSEPSSIQRDPVTNDFPTKVINSDSDAICYYVINVPGTETLSTYTYNNINDSGRQRSGGVWIGFT